MRARVLAALLGALVAGGLGAPGRTAGAAGPGEPPGLSRDADLYLVPVGEVPGELLWELAGHGRSVLGLEVGIAGPLPLLPAMADAERDQLVAEEITAAIARGLDAWVRSPDALRVGITGHDIYMRSAPHLRFVFGYRDGDRYAVISAARMDTTAGLTPARRAGLRKLLTKNVALQLYGLPPSRDPRSVLYGRIGGPRDLARIDLSTVGRDVLERPERARWHARRDARPPPAPQPGPPLSQDAERYGILGGIAVGVTGLMGLVAARWRRIQRRWREIAARRGWRFREPTGPWYRRGAYALELEVAGVPVVVDWFETGGHRSRVQWTRVRAGVGGDDAFRIRPETVGARLRRRLGRLRDTTVGEPAYDQAFLVEGQPDLPGRLPPWLRRRHLREPREVLCEDGRLVVVRQGLAATDAALLGLVQLAADFVCALRGRPRVEIAPDAGRDEAPLPGEDPLAARPEGWRRAARLAAGVLGGVYVAGSVLLLLTLHTERTNEPWHLAALGLGPVLGLGWVALLVRDARRLARDFATHALRVLLLPPLIGGLILLAAGPWVSGWNAWVDSREAWLYGPVMRKHVSRSSRTGPDHVLTIADSTTGRDVRLEVTEGLYAELRPGDPVAFAMRLGGLGIWYRQGWP